MIQHHAMIMADGKRAEANGQYEAYQRALAHEAHAVGPVEHHARKVREGIVVSDKHSVHYLDEMLAELQSMCTCKPYFTRVALIPPRAKPDLSLSSVSFHHIGYIRIERRTRSYRTVVRFTRDELLVCWSLLTSSLKTLETKQTEHDRTRHLRSSLTQNHITERDEHDDQHRAKV